ncbi:MAG: cyclic nucleotide-binding domain-containing protein [Anaerolineales bacterium]|jgi:CRP-like cAMP-binding protein
MGIMVSPEILRRFPFFASLDHATLCDLAKLGELIEVDKDEWLFHANDVARSFYIIVDGEVELLLSLSSKSLDRIPVTSIGKGELFGWSALVEPHAYQLDARCRCKATIIRMDGVEICEYLTHCPDVGCLLMARISRVVGDRLNSLRVQFVSLIDGGRWQHFSARRDQYINDGGLAKPSERNPG